MIDLCVVNFNTKPLLARLLDVLHEDDDGVSWKLYVADNGSTDGTFDWLHANFERYRIETVIYGTNVGYATACNTLAAIGDSPFIGLLNADVWLKTEDVKGIIRTFNEVEEAAIVGPKQRDERGFVRHGGVFGSNTKPTFDGRWAKFDPTDALYRDREEALSVSGSAYFVRRSVWEALTNDPDYQRVAPGAQGAFLPTPHYYEETWCSYFARHRGYKVFYDGTVSIGHSWHRSSPVKGETDAIVMPKSRRMFRAACDQVGIERE